MSKVLASQFSDDEGCYNHNDLNDGDYYYAELSTNPGAKRGWDYSALGGLGKYHKLKITYNGKSVIAMKGDVGRGKREISGKFKGELRKIDLHTETAEALNFNGLDYVYIEDA